MSIRARIKNDGALLVPREIHEVYPAFDETQQLDDTHNIDEAAMLSEDAGIETLFRLLLGLDAEWLPFEHWDIDPSGNLVAVELFEFVEDGEQVVPLSCVRFTPDNRVGSRSFDEFQELT